MNKTDKDYKTMTKKVITWVITAVTLLILASCSTPCNCGYAQAETPTSVETAA
jgi:hypothetical protein